tara:strand:- start:7 stop:363 length:357 start_codon:yes stop_codon:yes gene_type:complete
MFRVRVYWNLHKKCWSCQDTKTNKVVMHTNSISLNDVKFIVRKSGQKRVREERVKNVHAFVVGTVTDDFPYDMPDKWRVSYNPFINDTFVMGDNPVHDAICVQMKTSEGGRPEVYACI